MVLPKFKAFDTDFANPAHVRASVWAFEGCVPPFADLATSQCRYSSLTTLSGALDWLSLWLDVNDAALSHELIAEVLVGTVVQVNILAAIRHPNIVSSLQDTPVLCMQLCTPLCLLCLISHSSHHSAVL